MEHRRDLGVAAALIGQPEDLPLAAAEVRKGATAPLAFGVYLTQVRPQQFEDQPVAVGEVGTRRPPEADLATMR
jgi:hypothetical protein